MSALTLFRRVFLAAMLAGLCAGVVGWGVRQVGVVPLILKAEVYEQAAHNAGQHAGHHHDESGAWQPSEGMERGFFTLVTDVLAAIAFALLLAAVIQFAGVETGPWRGLAWGMGGYVAVCLAPAICMPPELPGTDSGALLARQTWWIITVMATAAGLLLARFAPHPAWYAVAILLVALPHGIGVPTAHDVGHSHGPPLELVRQFIVSVLVSNAIFWLALGAATGFFQQRMAGSAARA